jgi:membrane-associated phospholipid phosphatase
VRPYEAISAAYFLLLALVAPFARVDRAKRALGCFSALAAAVAVWTISDIGAVARDWAPLAYIAAGYWVPALLVTGTAAHALIDTRQQGAGTITSFEHWLLRTDTLLGQHMPSMPRWAVPVLEMAYLACYPLVPVGFLVVFTNGTVDDVNRFWFAVLMSGYACYGTLPWLQSRPPRLAAPFDSAQGKAPPHTPHSVARFNVFVLGRISHGWNTFPSGHAAMSFAVALAIAPVSVPASIATGIVAAGVAIGAVAGRYHYAIDVVLGALLAGVSAIVVFGL